MTTAGWNHSENADGPGNDPFHKNFSFGAQNLDAGDNWLFTGLRRRGVLHWRGESISAVKRSNACRWARSASGVAAETGGVAEGETGAKPMTEMTIAESLVTVDNWLHMLLLSMVL
jgi:hypothetical protein